MVTVTLIIEENLKLSKKIENFKNKLLDQLSEDTKVTFEKNTPHGETGRGANAYNIMKGENEHEITNETPYLPGVNDGTGIYGPKHQKIVPHTKSVLHSHWKGQEWFLKSVKGQKGQKFVEKSMNEVMQSVENAVVIAANETLK